MEEKADVESSGYGSDEGEEVPGTGAAAHAVGAVRGP